MTLQRAWIEGSLWAQAHPQCTRDEYAQLCADFTATWGPKLGGHFRLAVLNALRVIRRAA